jgi:high affinity Mn2+ porin
VSATAARADAYGDDYLAPHPDAAWWLSGEIDVTGAAQPGFHSAIEGPHSFPDTDQTAGTIVGSVVAGYAPTSITAIVVSGQSIAGEAFANGLGLGAPLDVDFVHDAAAGAVPYLGSSFIDQVIPLAGERVAVTRDANNVLATRPRRGLEVRVGKLSAPSWFDGEAPQFLDGAIRNDAGWEYSADQRGYTVGAIVEYSDRYIRARIAELAMPTIPRSADYDTNIADARAELAELDVRFCVLGKPGMAWIGSFFNHADMGSYGIAIATFELGDVNSPDVTQYRAVGATRSGEFGGIQQQLPGNVSAFAGFGWSDSTTESFGATETDHSARLGARWRGDLWHRSHDELGLGVAIGGLTLLHHTYLSLGGISSLLGDSGLDYRREEIGELYYASRIVRGVTASVHFELVEHPGFDAERGPITVGLLHVEAKL